MLLAHPTRMQTHSQQYESSYDLPPQNQDPAASVYIVPKTAEGVEMEALSPPSAASHPAQSLPPRARRKLDSHRPKIPDSHRLRVPALQPGVRR
jgi:hypothetical protein